MSGRHPHASHARGHTHGLIDHSVLRSRAGVRAVLVSLLLLGARVREPTRADRKKRGRRTGMEGGLRQTAFAPSNLLGDPLTSSHLTHRGIHRPRRGKRIRYAGGVTSRAPVGLS